ncbi:UNVERIFIED_CONTAM: sugar transferase [Halobacillus marinus]
MKGQSRLVRMVWCLVDSAVIAISYFATEKISELWGYAGLEETEILFVLSLLLSILTIQLFGLYGNWLRKPFGYVITSLVLAMITSASIAGFLELFLSIRSIPLNLYLLILLSQSGLLMMVRFVLWKSYRKLGKEKVWVIGSSHFSVPASLFNDWYRVIGRSTSVEGWRNNTEAQEADVLLVGPDIIQSEKSVLMKWGMEKKREVLVVPELYELLIKRSVVEQLEDRMVFSIKPEATNHKGNEFLKRSMDLILSSSIILFSLPIQLLLFILIPLTSPGPALYKQERIGKNGRTFFIYKFRSMITDAEKLTGPILASKKDPRITTLGSWMRAVRLDELPQLYNVLFGAMSLVGPRPEREFFIKQFSSQYPDYKYRHIVKPGITGLAQVMGNYTTSPVEKLRFDLMYINNCNLWIDLKIMLLTVQVLLHKEQAEGLRNETVNQHDNSDPKRIKRNRAVH